MKKFLKEVAAYLYNKNLNDLASLVVVFPNRRAGLFFQKYLSDLIDKPSFSPSVITINEMVTNLSGLQVIDQPTLIIELYQVYVELTKSSETLDDFYYWGEMMLSDFNDIDKYLVDATQLFDNIQSLKEIDAGFDFLTEEQLTYLSTFWANIIDAKESSDKEQFLTIWGKLIPIYTLYNQRLVEKGWAYEGMMYRKMAEQLDQISRDEFSSKYAVIGFNALNKCEYKLFEFLKVNSSCDFFWDYDEYYQSAQAHEAAMFMDRNMSVFPMPDDFDAQFDNFSKLAEIDMVAVPGFTGQATYASKWLNENKDVVTSQFDNTALVLCDETLLIPMLNAIPDNISELNITMGFPVKSSPVYALIKGLIDIDKNSRADKQGKMIFYYRNVLALLSNSLLKTHLNNSLDDLVERIRSENKIYLSEDDFGDNTILKSIFLLPKEAKESGSYLQNILKSIFVGGTGDDKLLKESIYQIYLGINRLHDSLFEWNNVAGKLLSKRLYYQLLLRQFERLTIPFEGEPLSGMQLMGFLETRCLDFDHLILLSFNDDQLPGNPHQHSFIPYSLRKGFGLPVIEQRNAMYAYYFYRLIQRAKKVTLVYDSRTEGMSSGEVSRFATQLKYEADHLLLNEKQAVFNFEPTEHNEIVVEKDEELTQKIEAFLQKRRISPSALNTYIDCKLRYFFRYIEGIKESEDVLEEINHLVFGRVAHLALEELYQPFVGGDIVEDDLKRMLVDHRAMDRSLRNALVKEFFKKGNFDLNGRNLLVFDIIKKYVIRILKYDLSIAPFHLESLEQMYENSLELNGLNGSIRVTYGGIVDRLDRVDDVVRVVDYKTGKSENSVRSIEQLFSRSLNHNKAAFQTMVYASCVYEKLKSNLPVMPAVYGARSVFMSDFNPSFKLNGGDMLYQANAVEFMSGLKKLLEELIDPNVPFTQTENGQNCRYCEFNGICNR